MKSASLLCLLVASTCIAHAQLLLDARTFSVEGSTGVAMEGRIEFWKDSASNASKRGTIKLYLSNLSVSETLSHVATGHEDGVLTGFGFNVGRGFNYVSNSFTETLIGPIDGLASGAEPDGIDFARSGAFSAGQESFQAGAFADNPAPLNGLDGGYAALFTLRFSAASAADVTNKFNAGYFFGDHDNKDLYLRFQSISDDGCGDGFSDKVFVGLPGFVPDLPVTPEPSTYGLMGGGLLFAAVLWRRRSQRAQTVAV